MPLQLTKPTRCFLALTGAVLTLISFSGAAYALDPLTFTARQAAGGKANFGEKCAKCHGAELEGGAGPTLISGVMDKYLPGPVDKLSDYIKANMPRDMPGTLKPDEIATLIAYIASRNDRTPGADPLPTDKDAQAKMGFDQEK
ncbi:MAG: hypothetical protein JWM33_802 [Caulobacteraceae bacterium]|nr:hypothetical protein [Caulobacteraceae bacterium]